MVPTRAFLLVLAAVLLAGCGRGDEEAATTTSRPPGPVFERGTVVVAGGGSQVRVDVEIAETPVQQQLGLMHRESLATEAGMVFVFAKETRGGFWMKNTLIPLSIAFYDRDGKILRILDMDPCTKDPCPVYDPGVPYRGALEVNQGAFREWGVSEGDTIRLER